MTTSLSSEAQKIMDGHTDKVIQRADLSDNIFIVYIFVAWLKDQQTNQIIY